MSIADSTTRWTTADAAELYEVEQWGAGYISVGDNGNLHIHPNRSPDCSVDLKTLVDRLIERGLELPILLRFNDILRDRLYHINHCFERAIRENEYQARYRTIFPIKVNQQCDVVQKIIEYGREFGCGIEAGSKPELLAVVAMADPEAPIICNGFKDDEFIEMALLAQKLGRQVIPVVEKYSELELVLRHAERLDVRPQIGMRVKLAARGSGRWQSSGGFRSKFGLTVSEILRGVRELEERGMADCFKLLHFHLGSQITNIRQVKSAVNEAARIYVELHRRGAGLEYLDVGGGLGVDYDGSRTNFESSMNYSTQEYANDVVYHIASICNEVGVPHPQILTESGRAVAAHHSILVFGTLGIVAQGEINELPSSLPENYEQPVHDLFETYQNINARNALESFHDASASLDMVMNLFSTGYLPLEQRVVAENLFFVILHRIRTLTGEMEYVPEDLTGLDRILSDIYFCNFSLFQSMPDSWAIKQLFPVMPIHRLESKPTRHAVLGDITCDSDGKIESFIDRRDVKRTLRLHAFDGSPYLIGAFLIGAYQEILGDLHNLFGDTHAVHVEMSGDRPVIQNVVKGDTVREVLEYVQFNEHDLVERLQAAVEKALHDGTIDDNEAGRFIHFYEDALAGYTYLEGPNGRQKP